MNLKTVLWTATLSFTIAGSLFAADKPAKPKRGNGPNAPTGDVPTAAEERAAFEVADGFDVTLYAADPQLAKPIQMNFDSQGRLWVVSSALYPQIAPGQQADDKVLILEDTIGKGVVDKVTVYADGLLIPTGVIPGDGGCYVSNSTELVHFSNPGPDGKAQTRSVVLSGFGTEDTHHILHTLRWGPDSRLYMNQSIYIHSHIETPYGAKRLLGGGIWRFDPRTLRLEVLMKGLVNTWGHHVDYWGDDFATDGAGGEGINYVIPGGVYVSSPSPEKIFHGLNPGSPKYAGLEIVSGRHLPDDWQGSMITNDFRASRVVRFQLTDDGAGFSSKLMPDVIKCSNRVFRPIDVKMGPDGAIYIADWCNPIINHGEVDFRDSRRDHTHGRIWKLTAKGRPLVEKPKLVGRSIEDLLELLKLPEEWAREQVKRIFAEAGAEKVAPALANWVAKLDPADPQFEHCRLEALWSYESINVVEPKLLESILNSKDWHARAAAVRTAAHWADQLPNLLALLTPRAIDQSPRVRLEAVRALGAIGSNDAVKAALAAVDLPRDKFLDYALWLTLNASKDAWIPDLQSGKLTLSPAQSSYALQSVASKQAIDPLLEQLRTDKLPADGRAGLFDLLATAGTGEHLASLLELAVKTNKQPERVELLGVLARAWKERQAAPRGNQAKLIPLLSDKNEAVKAQSMRLAGLWHLEASAPTVIATATNADASQRLRFAAIESLATLKTPDAAAALKQLAKAPQPSIIRLKSATSLGLGNIKEAAPVAVEVLSSVTDVDVTPLFAMFIQRADGEIQLASALGGHKIPADNAKLGLRALMAASRADSPLIAALTTAGGVDSTPKELTKDEMAALMAEVPKNGDPVRGEAVFRRAELSCLQCHAIGGAGGQVGPDMISIGASAPLDYIIDSVLLPNKAVKEGYASLIVKTKDGDTITGIKVKQTDTDITLRDATHDIVIAIKNIKSQKDGGSIMPSGLADSLTHGEFVDLLRFLSELGKQGPYAVGNTATSVARRWRVLDPPMPDNSSINPELLDANTSLTWAPVYSQVNGMLPSVSLPIAAPRATVRCQLEVTTPGSFNLRLNSAAGLQVWSDNATVKADSNFTLQFTPGVHTMTFVFNRANRPEGLKLELVDGGTGKAQFVSGK